MACDKDVKLKSFDYKLLHILTERGIGLTIKGALTISQQTIAEWCDSCCVRTVQSGLERLKAAGLIAWTFNYRTFGRRAWRTANSYFLIKHNPFNFMAWCIKLATRKPRKPLQSKVVHAISCPTETNLYKNKGWTTTADCGQPRDAAYWAMIAALSDR